jgi:two-component system sensor histidine kinase/response regulator
LSKKGRRSKKIAAALSKGDDDVAERVAHTLKGVAGNVGAKTVQSAASELEKAIRNRVEPKGIESAMRQTAC